MRDNYLSLRKAYENYLLNDEYELTDRTLKYIKERIATNKEEIKELLKIYKSNNTYEEVEKCISDEINKDSEYKDYKELIMSKDKYLSTSIKIPVGVIAVEAYDTLEVIKYYIKAISTRNAIVIADAEYDENNVKSLILMIIKEALKKFNIDEDLIMLLSYEECFYEMADKVIYTYGKSGNTLKKAKVINNSQISNNTYVYIEDTKLEKEARKNNNVTEYLYGDFDEVLSKINKETSKGAVIYTLDANKAYKFINLVKSKNVFVNTNLSNMKESLKSEDELYEYKNIILPMPQEEKKTVNDTETNSEEKSKAKDNVKSIENSNNMKIDVTSTSKSKDINVTSNIVSTNKDTSTNTINSHMELTVIKKKNMFGKIKDMLKQVFGK